MHSIASDKTILVVDDEVELCEILRYDLEDAGYQVLTACRVSEAMQTFQSNPVDLIISDVSMPGGDGVELLQSVRRMNRNYPPFLFLPGYADLNLAEAYAAGVQGFLQKPLATEDLNRAVARALQKPEERWDQKRSPEPPYIMRESFLSGADADGLSLGWGGFSLFCNDRMDSPHVGGLTRFCLDFLREGAALEGQAVCRWRRAGSRLRLGLEITYLTEASRRIFGNLRDEKGSAAFIPM